GIRDYKVTGVQTCALPIYRDRIRRHLEQLVARHERFVDPLRLVPLSFAVKADHLLDLRPDDVGVHADAADAADLEEREEDVVVRSEERRVGKEGWPRRSSR